MSRRWDFLAEISKVQKMGFYDISYYDSKVFKKSDTKKEVAYDLFSYAVLVMIGTVMLFKFARVLPNLKPKFLPYSLIH